MPEGHTLRRLADGISGRFAGQTVAVSSPQGRFADSASVLDGTRLIDAESWGKHLFVAFEGERWVHVHLGLYGTFELADGPAPPPVGQVRMRLESGNGSARASYGDLRGATACELLTDGQRLAVLDRLGPDPLREDADPGRAWARISRSRAPIGALLMDQQVLAGVGNVYRAEVLFRHRMHPLRPGNTLRRSQFEAMWADLVTLMAAGVRSGRIDTVRPEHEPEAMGRAPRQDDHGGEVYVYRRTDQACLVCGSRVRTDVLVGRNLFWCPRCQPRFRSRAASPSR
ncbi:Fpg/Nei family DNA glycosylase [Nocardioides mesophilus]|uniref:DNA-(apurinic or apyrimidinic site) lyase n=1 Tax=Nocardioides mesophilus TaxID=433659 RepID=A0A7G9RCT2_9ACTN|nr:Fpg/Nei family DNA glycosylase [Nocardioides mesophilus]QNN53407.1 Fpg/Nei family DNA glycosylase [Nocardioides mesophilus]